MKARTFDNATTIVVGLNRFTGVRTLANSNTWFWLLLSFLYKAILITCFHYSVYYDCVLEQTLTFNHLGPAVYTIMSILGFLSISTMQILGWKYYKEMSLLRKNIIETDQSLTNLKIAIDHRYIYMWIVGICTVTALNGFLYCIFYTSSGLSQQEEQLAFSDILHSIILYIGGMVVLDFMSHVCWLERSFKETNDLLKKFFIEDCTIQMEDWNNKMVASWLQRCLNEWRIGQFFSPNKVTPFGRIRIINREICTLDKINILQQIRYIHLQLCLIAKLLNKIFDTQIMFHSILTIQSVVATLYYVYTQLVINKLEDYDSVIVLSFYLFDATYCWLKVVVTCYFCERTAKEAKQIVHIIHVCSIHNSDIELKNELVQFCMQISLTEVNCRDTHLFWLNDAFILQSVGNIFTYFLIMIQWSQTGDTPGSSSNLTAFNIVNNNYTVK